MWQMKYFIQWLIVYSLICLSLFFVGWNGLFAIVNNADFTKLSFLILFLFLFDSLLIGISLFRYGSISHKLLNLSHFFADKVFTKLGFIGTIAGFIYALYYTFAAINIADIASTQAALLSMGRGIGTALFTTISGLIFSLLLQIQLYNYEKVG